MTHEEFAAIVVAYCEAEGLILDLYHRGAYVGSGAKEAADLQPLADKTNRALITCKARVAETGKREYYVYVIPR